MKTLKQTALMAAIFFAGLVTAQEAEPANNKSMVNMLKVGANVGIAVPQENATANFGLDLSFQHLVTPSFGLGIATGYNHYFGSDNEMGAMTIENNDFGVVPAAVLLRYYPKKTGFYGGADLGYGFIIGDDQVAANYNMQRPDGGFYIKPQIGYHNRDWNFFIQYSNVFTGDDGEIGTQKYNAGQIGAGVAYNIALGK